MNNKNNTVIYVRKSSNNSIEEQLNICYKYVKENNCHNIKIYQDEENSRTSFKKMIEDSEEKEFDYVIVSSIDRFSRNKYESTYYKFKLKENGIKVVSVKEENTTGILMESILEGMAEYYEMIKETKC